jgi:probable rRNA maturation factor
VSIEVTNESPVSVDLDRVSELCGFVIAAMRLHPQTDLAVLLVDSDAMTALHVRFMDEPGPTDVLSFPMDELRPGKAGEEPPAGLLGDIVLCPEVAQLQGDTAGHGILPELELLTVHGLLHLLGYDHADDADRDEMFALQKRLLTDWRTGKGEPVADTTAAAPITRTAGVTGSNEPAGPRA